LKSAGVPCARARAHAHAEREKGSVGGCEHPVKKKKKKKKRERKREERKKKKWREKKEFCVRRACLRIRAVPRDVKIVICFEQITERCPVNGEKNGENTRARSLFRCACTRAPRYDPGLGEREFLTQATRGESAAG